MILKVASAYEAATHHRKPPPASGRSRTAGLRRPADTAESPVPHRGAGHS